jgi:D-alanyl-D-alanine carboxypeptidase/D-alanyl-D-alanine-endopeptidase (penicillin-binding protein 4)
LARYITAAYAARVSALSLNENLVWIAVHPNPKGAPTVTLEPASTAIPVVNAVRSVSGSRTGSIGVRKLPNGVLEVRGYIGTNSIPRRVSMIVDNPATFTAGALRAALQAQGIIIEGEIRQAATPAGAVKVTSLTSPPLERLLSVMNRESINLYAELIYRAAARGKSREGVGSAERAFLQLRDVLDSAQIPRGIVSATDGSGLSSLDRMSPRALVHLLAYSHRAPWATTFHGTLPVAGESELLRNRMRLTPAQGNLHAKTGTTNTVASLGGYVTARDGEVLAFAFVYNGSDRWNAKMTMDQMGATLAAFVRE